MKDAVLTVEHDAGLHARPAAAFVRTADKFDSGIQVRNLTLASDWADAKSILSVLTLGVERGHQIELRVEGPDEQRAIEALRQLIRSNFAGELG